MRILHRFSALLLTISCWPVIAAQVIEFPRPHFDPNLSPPTPHVNAYVFSGGGSLGAFEVGVVDYLQNHQRIDPGILVGTSTGAIIAAKLGEGAEALSELKRLYLDNRGYTELYEPRPAFTRLQWKIDTIQRLQRERSEFGIARILMNPYDYTKLSANAGSTAGEILTTLQEMLESPSLFTTDALRQTLQVHLDPTKVRASGKRVRLATVNAYDGQLHFITEKGLLIKQYNESHPLGEVDLRDGVMASAAIPVAFPQRLLLGTYYMDGGVREMVPVKKALQLGANEVYVIYASRPKDNGVAMSQQLLPTAGRALDLALDEVTSDDVLRSQTLRIAQDKPSMVLARHRQVKLKPLPEGVELHEFRPTIDLHNSLSFDRGQSAIAMDYGYMLAGDLTQKSAVQHSAEQITELRYKARELEYELLSGYRADQDPTVFPVFFKDERYIADPDAPRTRSVGCLSDALTPLRDVKRQIRDLVRVRKAEGLTLPAHADRWWQEYEPHSPFLAEKRYSGIGATPWNGGICGERQLPRCDRNGSSCPAI